MICQHLNELNLKLHFYMEENKQTNCENPCVCSNRDEEQCCVQTENVEQLGPIPEPEPQEDEYVRNPQYGKTEDDEEPAEEPIIKIIQHHPGH